MLVSLDIETKCAMGCTNASECQKKKHALIPHQSTITCIGVHTEPPSVSRPLQFVFRDLKAFKTWLEGAPRLEDRPVTFVGHNLKFDLKHLAHHGVNIPPEAWAHDTQIMAATSIEKVSKEYLEWYARRRVLENEKLSRGYSHREGKQHSLKVLAPFFLNVEPFWEDPSNHDNDEYVLKDCEYTYRLYEFFTERLKAQGLYDFYNDRMMPWSRMLLEAEIAGMPIDLDLVKQGLVDAEKKAEEKKEQLDKLWAPAYEEYRDRQQWEIHEGYEQKLEAAIAKLKEPTAEKIKKTKDRYHELCTKACAKVPNLMNLDSPKQLAWILKDYLGLDITDFDDEESTGKPVLKKLAANRSDIRTFLEYRKYQKLATAFFPSYLELANNGKIHCTFNPDGTRTGRLSSSGPNLQQVPGELHRLFIAPPGMKVADYDMSAIEAKLIAYYTEDANLYYLVNSGDDFHGFNVVNVYFPELGCAPNEVKEKYPKERAMAKELGYALFYGAGWQRIQNVAQKHGYNWSEAECREKLQNFRETYRTVWEFKQDLDETAQSEPIENIFGRKAAYPDPKDIYMKAFNTLIQGTASDLVLESARRIRNKMRELGIAGGPRLFVHDEIVTLFDERYEKEVVDIITTSMTDYKLNTTMGPIKLEVEGKVDTFWSK